MNVSNTFGNAALAFANRVSRSDEGRTTIICSMLLATGVLMPAVPFVAASILTGNDVLASFGAGVAGIAGFVAAERPLMDWAGRACESPYPPRNDI